MTGSATRRIVFRPIPHCRCLVGLLAVLFGMSTLVWAADEYSSDRASGATSHVDAATRSSKGSAGGGTQADFDTLIELITSTIEPTSWEAVGGTGAINGFEGGVYVSSEGLLQQVPAEVTERFRALQQSLMDDSGNRSLRSQVPLRKVSLTRLQRECWRRSAAGLPLDLAMRYLAGLTEIRFLALHREAGQEEVSEIILVGPAGDWHPGPQGQAVNMANGRPVIPLDDLVVLLRNAYNQGGRFGCSITPRQQNLADTQEFLKESAKHPLRPGQRKKWLAEIRQRMGRQDISVHGVDPGTAVARVLVEADYHMKLVGMGLAEGVPGVTSYLDRVEVDEQGRIPPLSVLRWWFTLNYDAILTTPDRDLFALQGPAVQVLSENEFLTRLGRRVHTGKSDVWNRAFAEDFTRHFEQLAAKYPCYARLRNIFDLAMVAALLHQEGCLDGVGDEKLFFLETGRDSEPVYRVGHAAVPSEVETVVHHRVIDRRLVVAGVSGGVTVRSRDVLEKATTRTMKRATRLDPSQLAAPKGLAEDVWWWD